jgi:mRNA interferase YafQ
MRTVKYTNRSQRDYRREQSGRHGKKLDALLMEVIDLLAAAPLARHTFDHALTGEWDDHRDCHIRPDLVLIYRKPDDYLRRSAPFASRVSESDETFHRRAKRTASSAARMRARALLTHS